jgi:hypothetical protein
VAELRQSESEIHGDRGLADAAFAAGHRDEIFYARDRLAFGHLLWCWNWWHFVFLDVSGGVKPPLQLLL